MRINSATNGSLIYAEDFDFLTLKNLVLGSQSNTGVNQKKNGNIYLQSNRTNASVEILEFTFDVVYSSENGGFYIIFLSFSFVKLFL